MGSSREYKLLFVGAIALALVLGAAAAYYLLLKPSEGSHSGIKLEDFYAVYTGSVIGVYGKIVNDTGSRVCIETVILAENAEGVKAEIHRTVKEGNVYKMVPVDTLCIEPGGVVELRHGPGGMHIMVMPGSAGKEALEGIVSDGYVELKIVLDDGSEAYVKATLK